MKIVATLTDCAYVVHAGGAPSNSSAIIELPEPLPRIIKQFLENKKWASEGKNRYTYESLNFSILEEDDAR